MIIGPGSIALTGLEEDGAPIAANIQAGEMYYFNEQGVMRVKDFELATTATRSPSLKRIGTTVLAPQATVLDLAISQLERGQVEIDKAPIVADYPIALYRILKDYQTTAN